MAALYHSGGDFDGAYGQPLDALEKEWLAFLEAREGVTDDDVQAQAQLYKRRSVFQRPCAHRAATLLQDVGKAQGRGRWQTAIDGFTTLCELEPERPSHKLGLAQTLAVTGRFDEALAVLDEAMAMDDLTVTLQARILERRADVALAAGELSVAGEALAEALTLPLSEGQRRGLLLKQAAASDAGLAPRVVDYYVLFEPDVDGVVSAVRRVHAASRIRDYSGTRALGSYLMARQLLSAQLPGPARPLLEDALAAADEGRGLLGPEFVREARLQLVSACVQTGYWDEAEAVLDALAKDEEQGNGHRMVIEQWRARVAFFRDYFGRE